MWIRCKGCSERWNISNYQILPRNGYVCPECATKQRKQERIDKRIRLSNERKKGANV